MKKISALGIMSGTSLDGLDLAFCDFWKENLLYQYKIIETENVPYPTQLEQQLASAQKMNALDFMFLHNHLGNFIGQQALLFLQKHQLKPQLIASHGHTIFHQPEKGLSVQIGNPAEIASQTGIKTIADFRLSDVAYGGQGAPLVPIGDKLLFSEYDVCMNFGGFANLSSEKNGKRIAYDICAVNFVLNSLAAKLGQKYDDEGKLGRKGTIRKDLLSQLNDLSYYKLKPPKSLGREFVEKEIYPLLNHKNYSIYDNFRTFYEHISFIIANELNNLKVTKVLLTGGGAYNSFLVERIQAQSSARLIIPDKTLIDYKEALIFAFLGILRENKELNTLASVTGAKKDLSSGSIWLG